MHLHIVGGFLGSGKTTAIIGAARHLMAQGKRVGVITNDQGKYLVDTAFFELTQVPTVEVTGGCFCCNYDDLDARLGQLRSIVNPDVIFAESVGSCADIVATVVNPLRELQAPAAPTSFTVFTDIRLLRRWLLDQPMPFSDDVVYIFEKQIEEAGLLVINKRDLLPVEEAEQVRALARARYGDKMIRLQTSLSAAEVAAWVGLLESSERLPSAPALEIDYARYGSGEVQLAWLDEQVLLAPAAGTAREVVRAVLSTIVDRLAAHAIPVGHLKFLVAWDDGNVKLSVPALSAADDWLEGIPPISGSAVSVLVNARAQVQAELLKQIVQQAIADAARATGVAYQEAEVAAFHPGFPNPTHRLS